jgi:electron transport complex protein RnfG
MIKNMLKLGLVLSLFAGAACAGLAVVYSLTKDTIAGNEAKAQAAALGEIFPGADGFDDIASSLASPNERVKILTAFNVQKGGEAAGIAVSASGPSYGGEAVVLSGFTGEGRITRVIILKLQDTPGLGANARNPNYYVDKQNKITFPGQFSGKSLADDFRVKADVQAISASTITSEALTAIVKASGDAVREYIRKKGGAR